MTSEVITLIQELGFPVAISVGLAFALYSVVRFILKEKVEDKKDNLKKNIGFNKICPSNGRGWYRWFNTKIKKNNKLCIFYLTRCHLMCIIGGTPTPGSIYTP